jgi:4-deoxy-L-threo-5-hexosulose-uronate ketol-isomerase
MKTQFNVRYSCSPQEVKQLNTAELRKRFLIEDLFVENNIQLTYRHFYVLFV